MASSVRIGLGGVLCLPNAIVQCTLASIMHACLSSVARCKSRATRSHCTRGHLCVTVTFAAQPVLWPAAMWASVMVFLPRPQVLRASSAGLQVSRSRRTAAAPALPPANGSRDMARAACRSNVPQWRPCCPTESAMPVCRMGVALTGMTNLMQQCLQPGHSWCFSV